MDLIPNLIIGAGPAGLATAGRLRKLNIPFEVLEKTDKIACAWHNHYDRLCLHTVKQFSALPHLPLPADYPLYVPRQGMVDYFEHYGKHFDINPLFNEEVTEVKAEGENWRVKTQSGKSFLAQHVIIASGVNRVPNFPKWKGQDAFIGEIIHSRFYKNAKPFEGKKVLVVGMGNTGAELAFDLTEYDIETYLSVRSPVAVVPRDVNGRPVQVTAKQLAKLPFGLGDWLGTQIRKIVIGDLSKFGVPMAKEHPTKMLRDTGKTPVIDIGTVAAIKAGKIKVYPDIDHFVESGVVFKDGSQIEIDSVILGTGYRAQVQDFIENVDGLLDNYNVPKNPIGNGPQEGLFFVGFDNYKLGGILGTIFTDSETVVRVISQKNKVYEKA